MGNHDLEGGDRCGNSATCCTMCYAWASFLLWTILIFLLIFGIAFFAFVRSNLPQVKVHRLDIYKLNVTEHQNQNNARQLEIDVKIMVNVTNNNKRMTLEYGKMNVETVIEGYALPNVLLDGFRQEAMTANDLKIHPREMKKTVNEDDAKELKLTAYNHELVFSLKMKGKIEFWYNGKVMSNLHLKVSCEGIEQSKVDLALAPKCNVKLGYFG